MCTAGSPSIASARSNTSDRTNSKRKEKVNRAQADDEVNHIQSDDEVDSLTDLPWLRMYSPSAIQPKVSFGQEELISVVEEERNLKDLGGKEDGNFVDGLGVFQEEFEKRKIKIVGQWSAEGYDFADSEGIKGGYFFGLALDQDQQSELSDDRIDQWLAIIKKDFN